METIVDALNDMDASQKFKVLYAVGGGVVAVVSVVAITRTLLFKKTRKDYPRDTVILHQVGRAPYAPSMTPFAVKLETYLRMARIPYQVDECVLLHAARTQHCINFLNQKLGVDLNRDLSPADRGVAQAMKVMAEEHLYWFLVLFRWRFDNDKSFLSSAFNFKFGKCTMWMYRQHLNKQTWTQGLGRHTEGEITEMFKKDLQSMSDFMGTKKFLMGDEPCEADCAVFGQLSQFYWQFLGTGHEDIIKVKVQNVSPGPGKGLMKSTSTSAILRKDLLTGRAMATHSEEDFYKCSPNTCVSSDKYSNLAAYCERMKDSFWPDWHQCITHGGTREATK
ncbi:failed axon connections homolog [Haliotis rufescens]|uniref:failed axon connections homolog n=1 Tax=Haliotis rufescens TaxID=6454 RepID=UPI00201F06CF|nr:failed axon connections homolog [Haliotis rufescens]